MTDERRKAFEEWVDAPDQNYKDQASIYWSAFSAGCNYMESQLDSDGVVEKVANSIYPDDQFKREIAETAIRQIKAALKGSL